MLKSTKKKIIPAAFGVMMLLAPLSAFAASYSSTFQVYSSSGFTGASRSFNGDINIDTYNKKVESGGDKHDIKISLYRDRTGPINDFVGSDTHYRLTYDISTFTNNPAGDYFFKFTKPSDGVNVTGDTDMWD
jgi:hypothetical protein